MNKPKRTLDRHILGFFGEMPAVVLCILGGNVVAEVLGISIWFGAPIGLLALWINNIEMSSRG